MATKVQTYNNKRNPEKRPSKPVIKNLDMVTQQQTHPGIIIQLAGVDSRLSTLGDMRQLQHTIGNRAVNRLLNQMVKQPIQKKENKTGIPDSLKDSGVVVQRKPTSKVPEKDILSILARMENETLRNELAAVAKRLISEGTLWYDDNIKETACLPDTRGILTVRIPERLWLEQVRSKDLIVEMDAITIHELTHAAEVLANTGGDLHRIDARSMDTDMVLIPAMIKVLWRRLELEKKAYEAVKIESRVINYETLYMMICERINYAERMVLHRTDPSSREFPTVVNQLCHHIEQQAPQLKEGEFYQYLSGIQAVATYSRSGGRR